MAVLLPGAADLRAYWRNLVDGADAITDVPEGRWDADAFYRPDTAAATGPALPDQVYCRRGGFVDSLADVEVTRFGIMPNSVPGTEPDQLIALHVAAAAIADAGGEDRLPDRRRVGVVLGRGGYLTPGLVRLDQRVRTAGQLVRTLGELLPDLGPGQLDRVRDAFTERLGPDRPEAAIGLVPNLAASRVANRLDLRGPAYTVDAACASSLVAVDQAVGELASGRCDLMLAGGVHHCHDITLWSVFSQLRALSPSQRIRPFHRGADGLLIGEGTGVVVLKRLPDAERDGDRIYAVIRGTGVASDGRGGGLASPDPGGQAHAVRQAWEAAGLDPAQPGSIGLLEAHGTATPAGDTAELATLAEVFGRRDSAGDLAVIGSVKSMIGHTMPAAGVAGLVKAALAVHHGMLLPTLHCDEPHPALAATRFRTLAAAAPWETSPGQPVRRAAVNAFGFGGINAHVVLEQAPGTSPTPPVRRRGPAAAPERERVLVLAADTPDRLAGLLDADDRTVLAAGLDESRPHPHAGPVRLGIVAPTAKRLALARRVVAKGRAWRGRNDVWFTPEPLLGGGRDGGSAGLAFVFPGLEGDFEPRVDDVAEYFGLTAPASGSPRSGARARVGDVGRHGFGVVAVGRLLDTALRRIGVAPDAVAGHSVGEWTAMAAAGLYRGDAVNEFMESFDPDTVSVPGLAFGAVGAPAERVLAALGARADTRVVLSHDNAPNQSMVCGPAGAVEEFVRSFRAEGVISQVLPFESGFHTPMLAPYLGPIRAAAERFRLHAPAVPVWSATTASPYPEGEDAVRALFVRHLLEPVRFRQLVEAMYAAGFRAFVQAGTGQLASLVSDTLGGRDHLVVAANSPHRTGLAQLRRVAVALWTEGAAVAPDLPDTPDTRDTPVARPALPAPSSRVHQPVRLDLGAPLVSLGERAAADLRTGLLARPGTAVPAAASGGDVSSALDTAAGRFPLAAELSALLRDTAATAADLIAAADGPPPARGPARAPAPVPGPASGPTADGLAPSPGPVPGLARATGTSPTSASGPVSGPGPLPESAAPPTADRLVPGLAPGPVPAPAPAAAVVTGAGAVSGPSPSRRAPGGWGGRGAAAAPAPGPTGRPAGTPAAVRVSVDTMPYLLDHCFFPQRPGWPDIEDRWPVVPATTIVQHLMDAAERAAAPGTRAVAVHEARFDRWLTATPPLDVDVTVTVTADDPGRLAVSFGPDARAVVEVAARHRVPPPAPWRADPESERIPDHTAAQLYAERWMFHGPAFQGITELAAIGDAHVRARLTTPPAPGGLLDNVGQVLGYWIMATRAERTVVFPVRMRHMRFFGPHPRPGTAVECLVRITSLTDTVLEADAQLVVEGQVWAELTGWQDRRFDNDPQTRPVERFPERNTLSRARPGGWSLVHERWPDLASRDLIMRNSLSGAERSEYERHPPRGRRQWLLGRIAAKDAVRQWLWDHGEGPVFPAEIRVRNDEDGRPYVTGVHGRTLPPLDLSLAHRAEAGVAVVRPHRRPPRGPSPSPGIGVGIDIEEVTERGEETLAAALGEGELALLRARCSGGGGESRALWFTRFWAAKEAVAKAEGTGFRGRPRDFAVVEAAPDLLVVEVGGRPARTYEVRSAQVGNPAGLPSRDYVVAWTTGPTDDEETDSEHQ